MAEFTVTASELLAKAAELERLNKQLEIKIQVLQTEEAALKGMWEGEAKEAFSSAFNKDKGKMLLFHTEMGKYAGMLRTAASRYEAVERRNALTAGGGGI